MGKRFLRWLPILVLILSGVYVTARVTSDDRAHAYGTITNFTVTPTAATVGGTTTWTVNFTPQSAIPLDGGKVNLEVHGWNGSGVFFESATISSSTPANAFTIASQSGTKIVLNAAQAIAAGTPIQIQFANMKNPTQGGYFFGRLWTTQYGTEIDGDADWGGDYLSSYFEIGSNTNLKGQVTDGQGNAVKFANVFIYTASYSLSYYGYTDVNGQYGIGNVPAGTYLVSINSPNSYNSGVVYASPSPAQVTIESGVVTKNLNFEPAVKTITGRVTLDDATQTPVTDASVSFYRNGGGNGYGVKDTDANGNFSVRVPAGTWNVNISPKTYPSSWTNCSRFYDQTISFDATSTVESKTKNFTVDSLSSIVSGRVLKPDGTAASTSSVGLYFAHSNGCQFSAGSNQASGQQASTDGSFSARVAPGSYTMSGWVSDQNLTLPTLSNFSVGANETKDLGTITLQQKTDRITGRITDQNGASVVGATVSGSQEGVSSSWASTTTDATGAYSLSVNPGIWRVSAWPGWSGNTSSGSEYVYSGQSISVSVTSGVVGTANFQFLRATNILTGQIVDETGSVVPNLTGWVSAGDGANYNNIGATLQGSTYELRLPPGTWSVSLSLTDQNYSPEDERSVTFSGNNETKTLNLQAIQNNATIQGTVYDESGNAVTNQWFDIYAMKGRGGSWRSATLDQNTGRYSIAVAAGTWQLGWWAPQATQYRAPVGQDIELVVASGENKVYDIVLKKTDATISGRTENDQGNPIAWAWLSADTRDPNEKVAQDRMYFASTASSDAQGNFTLQVPAGTYWVGASLWYGSGYINPKRVKVTVDANTPASDLKLLFRTADSLIDGTTLVDGAASAAYLTAWSEDGGYAETTSTSTGTFQLSVSQGTKWHVKASKKVGTDVYKSDEAIVDLTTEANLSGLALTLEQQSYSLPADKSISFDPTVEQKVTLDDSTTLTIPANSMATSGTVTVNLEPETELPEQNDAKPVGYGIEMTAFDDTGEEITTFANDLLIEYAYSASLLTEMGLEEDELVLGYYDDVAGWQEVPNCTTNGTEDKVVCRLSHFTKFSLIAAPDTTPPSAPTAVTGSADRSTATLSWTNPTEADFASVTIYRSTVAGTLGGVATSGNTSTSFTDTNLTTQTTYSYTVRALDSSGNESSNTTQTTVTTEASTQSTASPTATASETASSAPTAEAASASPDATATTSQATTEVTATSTALPTTGATASFSSGSDDNSWSAIQIATLIVSILAGLFSCRSILKKYGF